MAGKKFHPLPRQLRKLIHRALAGIIRRGRERRHLTLTGFSKLCGLSRQTIGYVEDDRRNLSLEALEDVAAVFGLTGGEMTLKAEFWLRRLPSRCKKCHNCDIHRGELVCWNRRRGSPCPKR